MTSPSTSGGLLAHFKRYRGALTPLIGSEAADVVTSYYKWVISGMACFVLMIVAGVVGSLTPFSGVGLGAVVVALIAGIVCMWRAIVFNGQGARLASHYLTNHLGYAVQFGSVGVPLWWWRARIERERAKHDTSVGRMPHI